VKAPERDTLDWRKGDGLIPAVIQDADSARVLMLGYMNQAAFDETLKRERVVFYSRSRQTLWMKGETSGNVLRPVEIRLDCDSDTLLVLARPAGPTCHRGTRSCFGDEPPADGTIGALAFLAELESVINRHAHYSAETSYTARLLSQGPQRVAQKVGEEAVEVALAALASEPDEFIDEAADLVYHLLVLLHARNQSLADVTERLAHRHHQHQYVD
jgi:phosphoribosyl-ATP pyrophosphohydrolase/phosphoribosyl-AMP cyclohydrolase